MPVELVVGGLFLTNGYGSTSASEQCRVKLSQFRPSVKLLFTIATVYLVCSRLGPILSKFGESAIVVFELDQRLDNLEKFRNTYYQVRHATRVPGPFLSTCASMGNSKSRRRQSSCEDFKPPVRVPSSDGIKVKHVDDLGRVTPIPVEAKEPFSTGDIKSAKSQASPFNKNGFETENKPIKFSEIEEKLKTGDLAVLHRGDSQTPHYAIFIQHTLCDSNFPLLLLKGKTKPLSLEKFNPRISRDAHTVSATNRIFYGDYRRVAVHHLQTTKEFVCQEVMEIVNNLSEIPFSDEEIKVIRGAATNEERSAVLCTFTIAHFYKHIGELEAEPNTITPQNLVAKLSLTQPTNIKLPKVKEGPMANDDPPFLARLVNGILPPPEVATIPFSSIANKLDTGDIVLFSGATSSGAIIKFFDHSQFSHVGVVLRSKFVSQLLVWEASTNKAGLVDIGSGKVRKGVELLPLTRKIFSGWYDRVAIRRLSGIDSDKRAQMYEDLLAFRKEVQGRPYEKDRIELLLSSIDVQEKYLSFLRNTKEDLSSLFCSELVAEAYKRMGLLGGKKLSNEYTPDDFSTAKDINLNFGQLEPEEYVELKFDFQSGIDRQSSVY